MIEKSARANGQPRTPASWAEEAPKLCSVESIGTSYEGRDIWLVTVTNYVPMSRLVDPLVGVWQGESLTRHTTSLAVLTALGIAGIAAATRWFRWQATP